MTSNDLVIPVGIRLRIPSLLAFPAQVSCGEKPKATAFPFCSIKRCWCKKVNTNTRKEVCLFLNKNNKSYKNSKKKSVKRTVS